MSFNVIEAKIGDFNDSIMDIFLVSKHHFLDKIC